VQCPTHTVAKRWQCCQTERLETWRVLQLHWRISDFNYVRRGNERVRGCGESPLLESVWLRRNSPGKVWKVVSADTALNQINSPKRAHATLQSSRTHRRTHTYTLTLFVCLYFHSNLKYIWERPTGRLQFGTIINVANYKTRFKADAPMWLKLRTLCILISKLWSYCQRQCSLILLPIEHNL